MATTVTVTTAGVCSPELSAHFLAVAVQQSDHSGVMDTMIVRTILTNSDATLPLQLPQRLHRVCDYHCCVCHLSI